MSLQHKNSFVYSASYSTVHTTFLYDYFCFFQQRIRNHYRNVHAVGAAPKRPTAAADFFLFVLLLSYHLQY